MPSRLLPKVDGDDYSHVFTDLVRTEALALVNKEATGDICQRFFAQDLPLSAEERFEARLKLSKLPRNSAKTRVMNRCQITGRPHGVYRKLKISRIALRQLGLQGKIPGLVKSSW